MYVYNIYLMLLFCPKQRMVSAGIIMVDNAPLPAVDDSLSTQVQRDEAADMICRIISVVVSKVLGT